MNQPLSDGGNREGDTSKGCGKGGNGLKRKMEEGKEKFEAKTPARYGTTGLREERLEKKPWRNKWEESG